MGDNEFHPSINDEIDLSKNTNLTNKITPTAASAAVIADNTSSSADGFGAEDADLPIPNFLLKNKNSDAENDAATGEDDKFVNRSFKMVQDACKTLSDNTASNQATLSADTPPIVEPELAASAMLPQASASRNWLMPTAFAVIALGATAIYLFQPGLVSGNFASSQNSNDENLLQVASSSASQSSWGIAMAQNNSDQKLQEKRIAASSSDASVSSVVAKTTSAPAIILDSNQSSSLKARLSSAVALSLEKPAAKPLEAPAKRTATVNRSQIAALVAEQTQPKSTRSLNGVDASAKELEAEIKVATAAASPKIETAPAPVVSAEPVIQVQAVKTQKVAKPSVKIAQLSDSSSEKLRALTNNVVDQLARLKKFEENPQTAEIPASSDLRNSIAQLVQQASSQNLDSGAIEGLLNEALNNSNSVPFALAKADGSLDTRLLLMSVLAQVDSSQVKSSDQNYLSALDDEGSDTVVTTSLVAAVSVQPQIQENVRIVADGTRRTIKIITGDTLSKIALLVYGDVLSYTDIYKANRKKLRSPNLLTVGTILVLP